MRKLVSDWGQALVLLVAVAAMFAWGFGVVRSDIRENLDAIEENRREITALGREVSELRGELKGRDLIARGEDR